MAKKSSRSTKREGFVSARAAHRDELAEDYVELIDDLIAEVGEARVRDIAKAMGVSHVTVSRTVARLCDAGLAETEPYKPITLTAKGRRLARASRERHETVVDFLRTIGVPGAQAEIDAEGIEHHVSDATIRAMRKLVSERR